jgi:hypothetical protein
VHLSLGSHTLFTNKDSLLQNFIIFRNLDLSKTIDQHFPALGSNCALKASTFINTLVLSQHEGGECLDDGNCFLVEIIIPVGVCAFFWFLFLDWGIK